MNEEIEPFGFVVWRGSRPAYPSNTSFSGGMVKAVKDWTFDELANEVTRRLHDALIRGGGKEMRAEFHLIYNIITQWQEA